jgi:hypothetical protein
MRFPMSTASLFLFAAASLAGCAHHGREDHRDYWQFKVDEAPTGKFVFLYSGTELGKPSMKLEQSGESAVLVSDLRAGVQQRVVRTATYEGRVWATDDNGEPELRRLTVVEKGDERNELIPQRIHDRAAPGEAILDLPMSRYPTTVQWAIVAEGSDGGVVTDAWVDANVLRFPSDSAGGSDADRRPMRGEAIPIISDATSASPDAPTHQIRISGEDLRKIRDKVSLDSARLALIVKATCSRTDSGTIAQAGWYQLNPSLSQVLAAKE